MSVHYSRFDLNTYCTTPYFQAHVPDGYPLSRVLQAYRSFRRLPPNLHELSRLAKRWARQTYPDADFGGIDRWYDAAGRELDGADRRLSDAEIDAQWPGSPDAVGLAAGDVPVPEGGWPDPDTWEEPPPPEEDTEHDDLGNLTEDALLGMIESHGRERTAQEYGLPPDEARAARSDRSLASAILKAKGLHQTTGEDK